MLKFVKVRDCAIIPQFATHGSAGMDISSIEDVVLKANGGIGIVATGLKYTIPPDYEIQVRPRSGLASKHGVTVLNSPGTLDSDYRGEIKVILINHSNKDFKISKGDRIAQLVIGRVCQLDISEVTEADLDDTDRGSGGFGHTGI